jgi:dUTP pyrophosphatase
MKVRIKTFDKKPLFYETEWACGFDFKAKTDVEILPWEMKLINTWTVIEIPKWYVLQVLPRSSTFKKHWLVQVNSVWIIDNDYCGDNDEIGFQYLNMWKETVKIEAGTRIGQWIFLQVWIAEFEVVESMWENKNRWGFWSTGIK